MVSLDMDQTLESSPEDYVLEIWSHEEPLIPDRSEQDPSVTAEQKKELSLLLPASS